MSAARVVFQLSLHPGRVEHNAMPRRLPHGEHNLVYQQGTLKVRPDIELPEELWYCEDCTSGDIDFSRTGQRGSWLDAPGWKIRCNECGHARTVREPEDDEQPADETPKTTVERWFSLLRPWFNRKVL